MSRPLREGRAQRPHPLIVPGWPAGLAEWFVFQERELCPSFGLLVWNKYESSLISEWKNQTVLAPGSPDFGASCLPELSGKHTQAALHLDFWSCRMLPKKGSQWSHGSWACIVSQAGSSPFPQHQGPIPCLSHFIVQATEKEHPDSFKTSLLLVLH